jgi:hypothetical protein
LSQWLHAGLTDAGFMTELLETPHVKVALSAMTIKGVAAAMFSARATLQGEFNKLHKAMLIIPPTIRCCGQFRDRN